MLKNVVESVAVEKLKRVIVDRYGKALSIQFMQDASDLHVSDESIYLRGRDLHIPIQVHDHHFATAVITDAVHLSPEDKLTVSYMIRMVLEPEFYNWFLTQTANNARNPIQSDNVISLFKSDESSMSLSFEDLQENDCGQTVDEAVICLEATNPHLIPRLAYEIHELSQRWAFLKYSDIQEQVRSTEDLLSLGQLTLLIEDILTLSPAQQQIVEQYLGHESKAERPLLIIGTSSHIESLEDQGMISATLAEKLKSQRLEADRLPRDQKLLQETLEIMLHI